MNKRYETAIRNRETAAAIKIDRYDFHCGATVQLKTDDKYNGRVGEIIGIKYIERNGEGLLSYTVKLTDREAVGVNASQMRMIREAEI